jgi:hypothetical protein
MIDREGQSAMEIKSLGEGTGSGWKSSQGGTSTKTVDLREGTHSEGWKGIGGIEASKNLGKVKEEEQTLPEGWYH